MSITEGSALKVDDLKEQALPFLTDKAIEALSRKHRSMYVWGEGNVLTHQCAYLGKIVDMSKIEDGIKEVALKVNELAEQDLIHSALSHFIKYDLPPGYSNEDGSIQEQRTVVLCYLLVPCETYAKLIPNDELKELTP